MMQIKCLSVDQCVVVKLWISTFTVELALAVVVVVVAVVVVVVVVLKSTFVKCLRVISRTMRSAAVRTVGYLRECQVDLVSLQTLI